MKPIEQRTIYEMNQEEIRAFLAVDLPDDVTCFPGEHLQSVETE